MKKKYFSQIDPKLGKLFDTEFPQNNFRRFSCYYCSIANLVMQTSDRFFDDLDLLKIAKQALLKGYMDYEFFIKQPDGVIKLFDPDYFYIGYRQKSSVNHPKAIGAIEVWKNGKYKHFRLAFWDPMGDTSRTVKEGELVSYRLFNRIY